MSKPEMTNGMAMILEHWETHFPDQVQELRESGNLEKAAHQAAERAITVLANSAQSGMSPAGAMELAAQEWGAPPNL